MLYKIFILLLSLTYIIISYFIIKRSIIKISKFITTNSPNTNYITTNSPNTNYITNKQPISPKGICYFDIDNTLTTADGNIDDMMNVCLDNNFDIGIITASNRTLSMLCDGDKSKKQWMSDVMCKRFNQTNGKLYNSSVSVGGNPTLPPNYPNNNNPGYNKGFDMTFCRDSFYNDIPDKCLLLFDDDPVYLKGVNKFNPTLETECAHISCGGARLNINTVKNAVSRLVKNGCS